VGSEKQEQAPTLEVYPGAHETQAASLVSPLSGEYVPAAQLEQAPFTRNCPQGHVCKVGWKVGTAIGDLTGNEVGSFVGVAVGIPVYEHEQEPASEYAPVGHTLQALAAVAPLSLL